MRKLIYILLLIAISSSVEGALTRYAKVSQKTHYGWIEQGLQKITYYSGWELRDEVEGVNTGVLYCMLPLNAQGYGRLIELEIPVLAKGMVFSRTDMSDLFGGTRMVVNGHLFGGKKLIRYKIQARDFDGWYSVDDV